MPVLRLLEPGEGQAIAEERDVRFRATATDADEDDLSYRWWMVHEEEGTEIELTDLAASGISSGSEYDEVYQFENQTLGAYELFVEVSDGRGGAAQRSIPVELVSAGSLTMNWEPGLRLLMTQLTTRVIALM